MNLILNERFHNDRSRMVAAAGVSPSVFKQRKETVDGLSSDACSRLARAAGVCLEWLLQGTGPICPGGVTGKEGTLSLSDSFPQCRTRSAHPDALHIPVSYAYRNTFHKGWISVEQPFRGIGMIGVPLSDGGYPPIEAFLRAVAQKGWAMCFSATRLQAFRDKAQECFRVAQESGHFPAHAVFRTVDLAHPSQSCRVNPLRILQPNDSGSVIVMAKRLYHSLCLSRGTDSSDADPGFLQGLAVKMLATVIYLFVNALVVPFDADDNELVELSEDGYATKDGKPSVPHHWRGRYADIPHVLAFLLMDFRTQLEILRMHPQASLFLAPYWAPGSSENEGVFTQLEESTLPLRECVRTLFTPEVCWVLSGNDLHLRINDSCHPQWVYIAPPVPGDDASLVFSNFVFNSLLDASNVPVGQVSPTAFVSEDVVESPIYTFEDLFSTTQRSCLSFLLGIPSRERFRALYGGDRGDVFFRCLGHLVCTSSCEADTAQWLSDDAKSIGRVPLPDAGPDGAAVATALRIRDMPSDWIAGRTTSLQAGTAELVSSPFFARIDFSRMEGKSHSANACAGPSQLSGSGRKEGEDPADEELAASFGRVFDEVRTFCMNLLRKES